MKIAVIHDDARALLSVRGPLLARLAELGHQVHALVPPADEDVVAGIEALGVEYASYPLTRGRFSPLADLGTLLHLKQVLFRIRPGLVLSISHKPAIFGSLAARMTWVDDRKRIHALVTGLGYPFTKMSGWKRRVVHAYTKYFMGGGLGACHGIAFRTEEDREVFRAFGVLPDNVPVTVVGEPLPEEGVDPLLSFMELV
ncbi:MAG: glycosyltransferase [Desulfovibrionaceae bacterium]|nr:glycosyltransferase [Desulfovibrionaceae bacterium]